MTTDLFKQSSLLDDVWDSFLLDATSFVDVFKSVEILRLLVLNDSDLDWRERGVSAMKLPPRTGRQHRPFRRRLCPRNEEG